MPQETCRPDDPRPLLPAHIHPHIASLDYLCNQALRIIRGEQMPQGQATVRTVVCCVRLARVSSCSQLALFAVARAREGVYVLMASRWLHEQA